AQAQAGEIVGRSLTFSNAIVAKRLTKNLLGEGDGPILLRDHPADGGACAKSGQSPAVFWQPVRLNRGNRASNRALSSRIAVTPAFDPHGTRLVCRLEGVRIEYRIR